LPARDQSERVVFLSVLFKVILIAHTDSSEDEYRAAGR
jgi:hypothetical protein